MKPVPSSIDPLPRDGFSYWHLIPGLIAVAIGLVVWWLS